MPNKSPTESIYKLLSNLIEQEVHNLWPQLNQIAVSIDKTDSKRGDVTAKTAFTIAKEIKIEADKIARPICQKLGNLAKYIKSCDCDNGFINIRLQDSFLLNQLDLILALKDKYGRLVFGKGKKARVEFISANPTGPLHIGNARGGPLGDTIAKILEAVGYNVMREYFHNNIGNQVMSLGESIAHVSAGQSLKDQEYKGEYIIDLSKQIGDVKDPKTVGQQAIEIILKTILDDAAEFGVTFDRVYSESDFTENGHTEAVIELLRQKDVLREKDGAIWFVSPKTDLENRESVVVKSDKSYTYFANDIAYHNLKFSKGYDLVIDVLGPDHHGHLPRLQAAIAVLGHDLTHFKPIVYQSVRVKRGNRTISLSKRAGTLVTAREIVDAIGKDVFRFFMLMHDANTHIDFDIDLAKKRSHENPVFYVQYVVVRAKSIEKKVKSQSFDRLMIDPERSRTGQKSKVKSIKDYQLNPKERELILELLRLPDLVEEISKTFRVHRLTRYALDVADRFHNFYEQCQVIEAEQVDEKRLLIVKATAIVLENTLKILGISVPDKM